jgi:hypothetical protein
MKYKIKQKQAFIEIEGDSFGEAVQVYQDLSMYIGGVLGTRKKEMVKIDDDIMRDKKDSINGLLESRVQNEWTR